MGRAPTLCGLAVVLAALALTTAVRLRLADTPLERDEGEYACVGALVLRGTPPYSLAANMKFPGTYYAYAGVLAVFGETPRGIRYGLAIASAASALLVFALGRRLLGPLGGAVAGAAFALLAVDRNVLGTFAHATHFVLPPALGGLLLLLPREGPPRRLACVAGGALLGVAVLMKQHAAVFPLLGAAVALFARPRSAGRAALVAAGAALPLAAMAALLAAAGVWGDFRFWTVTYAFEYVSLVPLYEAWTALRDGFAAVLPAALPFWVGAAAGLAALPFLRLPAGARWLLAALPVASFAAVAPGFYFREHYFVLLLPAVALLLGAAAVAVARLAGRLVPAPAAAAAALLGFALLAGAFVHGERHYLLSMSPRALIRDRYGPNPFIEMVEVGRYLRERTDPGDWLAVLGSEPEVYFYADCRPAPNWLHAYPLMEAQPYARRLRDDSMDCIEHLRPKYIVFVRIPLSWGTREDSDTTILRWAAEYTRRHYVLVGIAEIRSPDLTVYAWDDEVAKHRTRSGLVVHVFRRRD